MIRGSSSSRYCRWAARGVRHATIKAAAPIVPNDAKPQIDTSVTGNDVTMPAVVAGGSESIAPVIEFDMAATANAAAPVAAIATYALNCACLLFVCSFFMVAHVDAMSKHVAKCPKIGH